MIYTYLLTNEEIYKKYVDVHIENNKIIGHLAYVIYFDPMGRRRKPKRKDPFLITPLQLVKAKEWAEMKAGIWRLSGTIERKK